MLIRKGDVLVAVVGGVAFWAPSIVIHALKGSDFSISHWRVLASVQPLTTLATFITILFVRGAGTTARRCALSMLLGIWILGPLCLFISATFDGVGFAKSGAWLGLLIATLAFPLMTPYMSLFDGSLVSLLISTFLLGAAASLDLRGILSRGKGRPEIL